VPLPAALKAAAAAWAGADALCAEMARLRDSCAVRVIREEGAWAVPIDMSGPRTAPIGALKARVLLPVALPAAPTPAPLALGPPRVLWLLGPSACGVALGEALAAAQATFGGLRTGGGGASAAGLVTALAKAAAAELKRLAQVPAGGRT
jgi:hypothetical protein